MRGRRHALGVRLPSAWSQYTSYVGVSGLHSENSYSLNAKRTRIEKEFDNVFSVIENMHRKEAMALRKERRDLELSMLAYSEKMKEINKARLSLPTIITPAGSKNGSKKRFSYPVRTDEESFAFSSSAASHSSIVSPTCPRGSPILSPLNLDYQDNSNENETKYLSPSFRFRHHSGNSKSEIPEKQRQRKICTISPPNPSDLRPKSKKLSDSTNEGVGRVVDADDTSTKHSTPNLSDSIETIASNVEISSFPDIKDEKERIRKSLIVAKNTEPPKKSKRSTSKSPRKVSVEVPEKEKPKKKKFNYKQLQKRLELEAQRKQAIAMMQRKLNQEREDKKHLGSCQSFRYSLAIQELLKKPDPFRVSKKEMVSKVEIENGRIVNTLGPAVLTVVDVDDMRNVRGKRLRKGEAATLGFSLNNSSELVRQISQQQTSLRLPSLLQTQTSINEHINREHSRFYLRTNSQRRFDMPRPPHHSSNVVVSAQA